jgi:hypothetical protein
LRLERCKLQDLESAILGIDREGDIAGSEIPAIYFDYLRAGDARGLQPVFHHNALDIMTLAAITVELARAIGDGGAATLDSVDLFSLSRMLEVAGSREQSVETCQRAISVGLPEEIEARALHQLAAQYKRQRRHDLAVEKWRELAQRESPLAIIALEELAIHFEHHQRNPITAMEFTTAALKRLREQSPSSRQTARVAHRQERLQRKSAGLHREINLPII